MKRIIEIVFIILLLGFCAVAIYYKCQATDATKKELKRVEHEFNRRLDSVLVLINQNTRDLDTVKAEIRNVKADTDTIKAGQKVLFETMQENKGKSLLEYLFQ